MSRWLGIQNFSLNSLLSRFSVNKQAIKQGTWLLLTTVISGIFNYLPHMIVGRWLGPAKYGVFASMISISTIIVIIAGISQMITTSYVARFSGTDSKEKSGAFLIKVTKLLLPVTIAIAIFFSLLSPQLSKLLRLDSEMPIIFMAWFIVPSVIFSISTGVMRGLLRFGIFGSMQIFISLFRLLIIVVLLGLGMGVNGAVASLPLSILGTLLLSLYLLKDIFGRGVHSHVSNISLDYGYFVNMAIALLAYSFLTAGDVLVVKSYFLAENAGLYSSIATLGKIGLWLSTAIGVMFMPMVIRQHVEGKATAGLLLKCLFVVVLLSGGLAVVFTLFPSVFLGVLFGKSYQAGIPLLGIYGFCMALFSIVYIWMTYYISLRKKLYTLFLVIGSISYILLVPFFNSDLQHMIILLIGIAFFLCISGGGMFFIQRKSEI